MTDEQPITVHTIPTTIQVSREFAAHMAATRQLNDAIMQGMLDHMRPRTAAEQREDKRRAEEREAKRVQAWEANIERHDSALTALTAADDPYAARLVQILDNHGPDGWGHCPTCSGDEWSQDWPCETWSMATGTSA
jgi:hypothetical protein